MHELNKNLPVELAINLDFQKKPLIVTGNYETVMEQAQAIQALDARKPVHIAPKPEKPVLEPVHASQSVLTGRRATITAKLYDMVYGSNMTDLLKQKRAEERDLAMAGKLGLLSIEDLYCARHRKAVDKLRSLAVIES